MTTLVLPEDGEFVEPTSFTLMVPRWIGRLVNGAVRGEASIDGHWVASYAYGPMTRAAFQRLSAWVGQVEVEGGYFIGHDPHNVFPAFYPAGFGTIPRVGYAGNFTGVCDVTGISSTSITIAGLGANMTLLAGDKIALIEGTKRKLFQIAADYSSGAGGAVTVAVTPRVPTYFTTAAEARLDKPQTRMMLQPGTFIWSGGSPYYTAEFAAVEAPYF
jgi:hypothetical protein